MESSAYECIGLDMTVSRSLLKMRNRVSDNTQPCGRSQLIGWGRRNRYIYHYRDEFDGKIIK